MLGSAQSEHSELINSGIIFEDLQPMWSRYLNVTDRETTCRGNTALCVASRGKNAQNRSIHKIPTWLKLTDKPVNDNGRVVGLLVVDIALAPRVGGDLVDSGQYEEDGQVQGQEDRATGVQR